MTLPIYASPEQFMRDRSDYARKGIARGRSVVVTTYAGGVLFVAENRSPTLHKVSEIYDRIGFAGVGRYNEFENLRTAGIRLADVRGYSYDRRDVTGRWLANAYAQTLGSIFSEHQKPFEVELCVAEVARDLPDLADPPNRPRDQLFRISYDGSISDEDRFVVMGGVIDPVVAALDKSFVRAWALPDALRAAVAALGAGGENAPRGLVTGQLEVAVLDRYLPGRTFRRVDGAALTALLTADDAAGPAEELPTADDVAGGPQSAEPATGDAADPAEELWPAGDVADAPEAVDPAAENPEAPPDSPAAS